MARKLLTSFLLAVLGLAGYTYALPSIEVHGQYFMNPENGGQFIIVGIDYILSNSTTDPAAIDPMHNPDACVRDAALLQKLGINTIHVTIDPTQSHDECFSIFDSVGIYVLVSINWNNEGPLSAFYYDGGMGDPDSLYTLDYLQSTFAVIDAVKDYENLLGFFVHDALFGGAGGNGAAGNLSAKDMIATMYTRALVRDTKQYVAKNSARVIPVGYSVDLDLDEELSHQYPVDVSASYDGINHAFLDYTTCTGVDIDSSNISRADFFGITNYYWCPGNSSLGINGTFLQQFYESGWEQLSLNFTDASVPIFMSDYGCIFNTTDSTAAGMGQVQIDRSFLEVTALYNLKYMAGVFSGGILFEYANVQSAGDPGDDYGLVNIDSKGNIQLRDDYETFSTALAQFDLPAFYGFSEVTVTKGPPQCPSVLGTATTNGTSTTVSFSVPTQPSGLQALITSGTNATRGKIISVTQISATFTVKGTDGKVLAGLAITPNPSFTGTSTNTSTALPTQNQNSTQGLSTGAKAGIGVAVPLGIALIAGLAFFFWQYNRKGKKPQATESGKYQDKPELEANGMSFNELHENDVGNVDGSVHQELPLYELDIEPRAPLEMGAGHARTELE